MRNTPNDSVLVELPGETPCTFLDFPFVGDIDTLDADIAVLGIPYGKPYAPSAMANDQSRAPDALRQFTNKDDIAYNLNHYDWDLRGTLLDDRDIKIVDCGNVTADMHDHKQHYIRAEQAARKILSNNTTLISLGGDHGIPIPVLKALEVCNAKVTLVQIDAHLDWRDELNGEKG